MGKTFSLIHLRASFGIHLRSFFTLSLIILFLTSALFACQSTKTRQNKAPLVSVANQKKSELKEPIKTQQDSENEDMVWIPEGPFLMGTNEVDTKNEGLELGFPQPWYEDERPQHRVKLKGYHIDRYEVTQEAYLQFVRKAGHMPPPHWRNGVYKVGRGKLPVTFVDWYDANDYCLWKKLWLPTEAQWEKAARGATGRRYPWGEVFDATRAHLSPASDVAMSLSPVGRYPEGVSHDGVHDMVGNVWEWTASWYMPYPGSKLRKRDFGMKHRAVRGLSFHSLGHYPGGAYPRVLEVYARAATRSYDPPSERLGDLGFRCIKRENLR